jgi:multidrug efflux system outer membrane protein
MRRVSLALAGVLALSSCLPNTPTAPPNAHVPSTYRGPSTDGTSLGAVPWRKLYDDPVLQGLIEQALVKNYSVEQAYQSVLEAQANLTIVHAGQLPVVGATVQAPYQNVQGERSALTPANAFNPEAALSASYEVDLFGKLASSTAAARAQLLATEEAQNSLFAALVSEVANAYFQLLDLDATLEITKSTIVARTDDVRLTKLRVDYGESSLQDLRQAQQALYETTENLPLIEQNIAQTENALSVLTGDYPHDITRGLKLDQQVQMPAVPAAGLPSELLERRPDIKQAEFTLVAADAQLDVARKLLYPSLNFGASATVAGQIVNGIAPQLPAALVSGVNGVFTGPQGLFSLLPSLTQPIFNGGKLKANVHLAQAEQQQLAYAYLQTVQNAFEDVSNALAAYDDQRKYRVQVDLYAAASLDSTRLANERYEAGETSYLEVLNAQTRSYQAEIAAIQARLDERLALVALYQALGGGWQN